MTKKIYSIVRTPYHLFLTLLLNENRLFDGSLGILYYSNENNSSLIKCVNKLKRSIIKIELLSFNDGDLNSCITKKPWIILFFKKFLASHQSDYPLIRADEFIFFVSNFYEVFIFNNNKRSKYILLEDGEAIYKIFDDTNLKGFVKKLFKLGNNNDKFKIANEIWCQTPERIEIKSKALSKKIDLKHLMSCISDNSINEILIIFGIKESELSSLLFDSVNNKRKVLLLTQCFSENNALSEDVKISYYRKIIEKYLDDIVIIKPHPREITNYKKLFPSAIILPVHFPIEILNYFNKIKIDIGITINSSSLNNCLFIDEKIFLGYENFYELNLYYDKILK